MEKPPVENNEPKGFIEQQLDDYDNRPPAEKKLGPSRKRSNHKKTDSEISEQSPPETKVL